MIDVYAPTGLIADRHKLAENLARTVMRWEKVPEIPLFLDNTAAFVHELDTEAFSTAGGDNRSEDLASAAGEQGCADLVTTASIAALDVFPGFPVYGATKAYVAHLGTNLRQELAPKGIRAMTVEPGIVDTELQNQIADADVRRRLSDTRDRIEWLTPADIAEVVLFAVSRPARVSLPAVPVLSSGQTR
ncbi:SDR family oxidoreductase [Kutzneria sp. NPDC052558]|uniref:SDR family oxidoreductase n=1 Tax=Kutzneria sp. NPDC052558 TaxID=3364121 RepID=UPI0037C8C240